MSKFTLPAAVAAIILFAAAAPPALAQAANPEPGFCAQFYPNSDCNSVGPETPGSNKTQGEPVENDASEAAPASPPAKPANRESKPTVPLLLRPARRRQRPMPSRNNRGRIDITLV
jgi:hypothetical protein